MSSLALHPSLGPRVVHKRQPEGQKRCAYLANGGIVRVTNVRARRYRDERAALVPRAYACVLHLRLQSRGVTSHTGGVPSHAGGVTSHTGGVPSHAGGVPSHAGGVTSVPSHAGGVPSHTGGVSSHAGGVRAAVCARPCVARAWLALLDAEYRRPLEPPPPPEGAEEGGCSGGEGGARAAAQAAAAAAAEVERVVDVELLLEMLVLRETRAEAITVRFAPSSARFAPSSVCEPV
eukprot:1186351-Prorocentrum_minimum.AAC.3